MLKKNSMYSHPVSFYRSVNTRYVGWIPLLTWCRSPVALDTGSGPRPYFPSDINCNILEWEIAALDSIHKVIARLFPFGELNSHSSLPQYFSFPF